MTPERAAQIQALKQHPAWAALTEEIRETYDKYVDALGKKMMADGAPYNNFEYKRGYLKGLMEVARMPDEAIVAIQKDNAKHARQEEHGEFD